MSGAGAWIRYGEPLRPEELDFAAECRSFSIARVVSAIEAGRPLDGREAEVSGSGNHPALCWECAAQASPPMPAAEDDALLAREVA